MQIYSWVDINLLVGRPANADRAATLERILDAAEHEFAAVGYAPARLSDIAGRAGIRRPSLLYHFASKGQLYQAVVERVFDHLAASLGEAMAREAASFEEQLDGVVRTFAAFLDARPTLAPIIVRELIDAPVHGEDAARRGGDHGRTILLERVVPLLGQVETFIRHGGAARLRPGLPVRAALADVAAGLLIRSAAGSLREPIWGPGDHALTVARALLFRDPGELDSAKRRPVRHDDKTDPIES